MAKDTSYKESPKSRVKMKVKVGIHLIRYTIRKYAT